MVVMVPGETDFYCTTFLTIFVLGEEALSVNFGQLQIICLFRIVYGCQRLDACFMWHIILLGTFNPDYGRLTDN